MDILVPVIGELQSMLWLDKRDAFFAQMVSDATDILGAISDSQPEKAGQRAQGHGERLTSHLVARRAHRYAEVGRCSGGFDTLVQRMDGIRVALGHVSEELRHLKPTRRGSATALNNLFCDVVEAHEDLVRGAGIAYAPDMLTGRPLWMDWWDSGNSEGLAFKSHIFSNASLQYYDYTRMAWFTEPLRTGAFSAHGPYLDRGGIERVTITVSLPVTTTAFSGSVLGADLRLGRIGEIFFADADSREVNPLVLLDAHERVVASAVPGLMPGDVITSGRAREISRIEPTDWPELGGLGWRTARMP